MLKIDKLLATRQNAQVQPFHFKGKPYQIFIKVLASTDISVVRNVIPEHFISRDVIYPFSPIECFQQGLTYSIDIKILESIKNQCPPGMLHDVKCKHFRNLDISDDKQGTFHSLGRFTVFTIPVRYKNFHDHKQEL